MNDEIKKDLLLEVKHMVNFPFAQICRHSVALNILSLMEKHGYVIPNGLAKAICNGCNGDAEAMDILQKELQ